MRWSPEASDTNVTEDMREAAQQLADSADVDLLLSSGRRAQGNDCSGSRHNCGKAIDISAINGVDIGQGSVVNPAAAHLIEHVQGVARGMSAVRENYGPAGLFRSNAPGQAQVQRLTDTPRLMNLQLGQHGGASRVRRVR